MQYKCSSCDYTSNLKGSIVRHIERKYRCGANPTIITERGNVICVHCGKKYKTNIILRMHHRSCQRFKEHQTPTYKNIPLRSYVNPKLPDDADKLFEECWTNMRCVLTYIKGIYFNDKLPENHSMCISSLSDNMSARIYYDGYWSVIEQDNFINNLVRVVGYKLDEWVRMDQNRHVYMEQYTKFMKNKNSAEVSKETNNYLKLMLYSYFNSGYIKYVTTVTPYSQK